MTTPSNLDSSQTSNWLEQMASALTELTRDTKPVMLGIKTGGVIVAQQLQKIIQLSTEPGELNISFYRDDFSRIGLHPQVGASQIPFTVDGQTIILVDDVLYSGRTVRAAMNEIFDFGRPDRIILAVLIERQGRDLPIKADVTGCSLQLTTNQNIKLRDDLSIEFQSR